MYTRIFRPILFSFSGEVIHEIISKSGEFIARVPGLRTVLAQYFRVNDPLLHTVVDGNSFEGPVGLSAGFDKNGELTNFAHLFGFGHMEVGSITGSPYVGNPGKHIRRLVKNESLIINYGLKSDGAKTVYARLAPKKVRIPLGISIAKTNRPECAGTKAIEDYAVVYETFVNLGNWHTINLSCPNTVDGTPFSDPENLRPLLERLSNIRKKHRVSTPMYLKVNPDISRIWMDAIIELAKTYKLNGFVIGNLIKDNQMAKSLLRFPEEYDNTLPGHLSGHPTRQLSLDLIRYVRNAVGNNMTIIGCGGVFTGRDAYEKIVAGANLIQLITGFVFGGPGTIRTIHKELAALLRENGFRSVNEAVGTKL